MTPKRKKYAKRNPGPDLAESVEDLDKILKHQRNFEVKMGLKTKKYNKSQLYKNQQDSR